ncbi:DUF4412 domain-containing protein [Algoriphagus kandeliae]|uniref:DUF4412 domain-containing protein n=1 Tax=Algoriphagus kandeliae TaxID=2562278 RepID=A0A4Y9R1L6_9BACT|nr:DUF4412 domain-containing protein [Algoriphagus kandeliae]TFV97892.1 DUF4412 domain-containing protein [Algoriphagus kandeliae]
MRNLKIIFSLFFLISIGFSANSQVLKKLKKAVEESVSKSTNEKSEEETNKMLEGMMGALGEPADVEESYAFSGFMILEITSTNSRGKSEDPVRMKSFLSENPDFSGIEIQDPDQEEMKTVLIMDLKNQATVLLMDDGERKSSMAIGSDFDKIQEQVDLNSTEESAPDQIKITKTGNTKEILGFHCEEYEVEQPEGKGTYWVSQEAIKGFSLFSPGSSPMVSNKTMDRYQEIFSSMPKGSILEMHYLDKDGSSADMKTIDLQTSSPSLFNLQEYPNVFQGK